MKKYYHQLLFVFTVSVLIMFMVIFVNTKWIAQPESQYASRVVLDQKTSGVSLGTITDSRRTALILYSPGDSVSCYYKDNLIKALEVLRMEWELQSLDHSDSVSYPEYDLVILASPYVEEEMADPISRLFDYVSQGGKVFWGILPVNTGIQFSSVYRQMGIVEYGDYKSYSSFTVTKDLVPGMSGRTFSSEAFEDVGLALTLDEDAQVYASALTEDGSSLPMVWNFQRGEGSITFYNGTGITGDYWRGFAAGCILTLFEDSMYPIINALCLFIDDFPSPQYESSSDVVREEYNRSVKEFYRDIWWPDMQAAAQRYGDLYTGLFMATYNDIVDPEDFTYDSPSMEQYYGNSLIKSGYELGAHGYNHQSLAQEGQIPENLQYVPWESVSDMESSLEMLQSISEELFPGIALTSYVPPSNYLSQEGRSAVKAALEDLKVISGVYTSEGEEGSVYVQDFEIAEDGIAEFPRISSGMLPESFDTFSYINGIGLYGVFSHFIHPDDIFDEDRGKNQSWEALYESYCQMIEDIHSTYPWLRSLTATDAADALLVQDSLSLHIEYGQDEIRGSCENFYGEAYFYLRTEKQPQSADGSCTITPVGSDSGSLYYLVTVTEPDFTVKLVNS